MKYLILLFALANLTACLSYESRKKTESRELVAEKPPTPSPTPACVTEYNSLIETTNASASAFDDAIMNFRFKIPDNANEAKRIDRTLHYARQDFYEKCVSLNSQYLNKQCPEADLARHTSLISRCSKVPAKPTGIPHGLRKYMYERKGNCEVGIESWGIKFEKFNSPDGSTENQYALFLMPFGDYQLVHLSKNKLGWLKTITVGSWTTIEDSIILGSTNYELTWDKDGVTLNEQLDERILRGSFASLKYTSDGERLDRVCDDVPDSYDWF